MRKLALAGAAVAALVTVAVATPADAITRGGTLDDDEHPHVMLMVATDGVDGWRCSGTLISPTVYVTAGHCTYGAEQVWIYPESDVDAGIPANGYPFGSPYTGKAHTHPKYDDGLFFLHDLGVVVLDTPLYPGEFGELPSPGVVDELGKGRKTATVTAVGYGLQAVKPVPQADRVRYQAELFVVNTQGVAGIGPFERGDDTTGSFLVSGDSKHGGTCFGDSGGPMFAGDTNVIVGVNSFGLNANCAGVGGAYRIDEADDLDFISSFLG